MGIRVKICGITTLEAALAASDAGADAVGFVFAESPRRIAIDTALELTSHLSQLMTRVAVFRYPEPSSVDEVISELRPDVVQVEPTTDIEATVAFRSRLLPVFHDSPDLGERITSYMINRNPGDAVLLEAPGRGGRGAAPSWQRAVKVAQSVNLVLAGGLSPLNVEEVVMAVAPYAVDVSSGVESSPGVKDPRLIEKFIAAARRAGERIESTIGPLR